MNSGENELTRLLLAEEAIGAPPLAGGPLAHRLDPADYPENAHSGKASYDALLLRDCLTPALWQELRAE